MIYSIIQISMVKNNMFSSIPHYSSLQTTLTIHEHTANVQRINYVTYNLNYSIV